MLAYVANKSVYKFELGQFAACKDQRDVSMLNMCRLSSDPSQYYLILLIIQRAMNSQIVRFGISELHWKEVANLNFKN